MDVTLFEELAQNDTQPAPIRRDGFGITVSEYKDAMRARGEYISDDAARKYLNELVEVGVLKKKMMVWGRGSTPFVYYKDDEEST